MKYEILTGEQISNDYPYGRLRCKITFNLEFKPGKGYRFVSQTTNPKNDRVNAPKRSTYSDFMAMIRNEEGQVRYVSFDFRGYNNISNFISFLNENEISFTPEQSQHLWAVCITCIRGNVHYTQRKEDVTLNELLNATKVEKMIQYYGKKIDFGEIVNIGYDIEEIIKLTE
jgi:hypothetical protein